MEQLMAISYLLGFFTAIIFVDCIGEDFLITGYFFVIMATLMFLAKNLIIMIRTGKIGQKKWVKKYYLKKGQ